MDYILRVHREKWLRISIMLNLRGAIKIKCDKGNKTKTVPCTKKCISSKFFSCILPIRMHFSMGSYHAGSRRRPGLRSWNPWPPPRSSSSPPGSAWWHTADSFLWVTGNTLPRIYQAKIRHFWDPGSRRRPTKCTQRRRRAHQIWSLIVNFFTMHRTSSRMLKFVLTEPVGHVQDLSQWPGILLNSLTATVATRSWIVLIFFEIGGGPVHQCFWWP